MRDNAGYFYMHYIFRGVYLTTTMKECCHKWLYLRHKYLSAAPGVPLNIDMPSYQYRDFHYKDNSRSLYLYNGNPYTRKGSIPQVAWIKSYLISCDCWFRPFEKKSAYQLISSWKLIWHQGVRNRNVKSDIKTLTSNPRVYRMYLIFKSI